MTKLKIKSISKLRPFDPIEVRVPIPNSTACYLYRRYENGVWYRSEDNGKTYGQGATQIELALLVQLLILWAKVEGVG